MTTTLITTLFVVAQAFLAVRVPIVITYSIRSHRSRISEAGPQAAVPNWLRWLAASTPMRLLSLTIAALACTAALLVAILHPSP